MADYFLDTSALVKRHVAKPGSEWIRALVHARAAHSLYIARVTAVEMTSAITRRQNGGSLSQAQGRAIFGHFRRHLAQRYLVIEVTPAFLTDAMLKAREHGLRAYDAVQLAVAVDLHRRHQAAGFGPIVLISADQELNDAAAAEGMAVEDPRLHA